jgi:hypothetical protein
LHSFLLIYEKNQRPIEEILPEYVDAKKKVQDISDEMLALNSINRVTLNT